MPAQKLDKQHSLKILNMEPTGVSTNSHQQLMSDCDSSDAITCSGGENDSGMRFRDISRMKWFTVIILCFVNLINYMDRFTLAGVLTEIQTYFGIGEAYGGLLQTAFVLSYMLFAPLFGYLGDRYNRRYIMAFGVFLWSLTTLIGSYMESFTGFIIFRALVGIGEASYSTIAPTIISDLFVKDMRSRMLALFYFAIPVGSGLGYIVGSETARVAEKWQWGLRVTPSLGALAVVLILFVMLDPERGQDEVEGGQHFRPTSWWTDIKELSRNASFMLSTAGFTCVAFVAGALAWWGPTFIFYGLQLQAGGEDVSFTDLSFAFGLITMLAGIAGLSLGTFLSSSLKKRYPKADPVICAMGLFISAPLLTGCTFAVTRNTTVCFVLLFFGQVALNLNWAIVADILLYVVIPTRRSTAEAFQILVSHALGDAGSPYLIGVVSEALILNFVASRGVTDVPSVTESISVVNGTGSAVVKLTLAEIEDKFRSLQYALFTTSFVEVLGGFFFLCTALYVIRDKMLVDQQLSASAKRSSVGVDNPAVATATASNPQPDIAAN